MSWDQIDDKWWQENGYSAEERSELLSVNSIGEMYPLDKAMSTPVCDIKYGLSKDWCGLAPSVYQATAIACDRAEILLVDMVCPFSVKGILIITPDTAEELARAAHDTDKGIAWKNLLKHFPICYDTRTPNIKKNAPIDGIGLPVITVPGISTESAMNIAGRVIENTMRDIYEEIDATARYASSEYSFTPCLHIFERQDRTEAEKFVEGLTEGSWSYSALYPFKCDYKHKLEIYELARLCCVLTGDDAIDDMLMKAYRMCGALTIWQSAPHLHKEIARCAQKQGQNFDLVSCVAKIAEDNDIARTLSLVLDGLYIEDLAA